MIQTVTQKSKLDMLREQQARIQARIAEVEAQTKAKARKEDARLKIIVGAACLADAALREETKVSLRRILERAIKAPRDQDFLRSKGWL